MNLTRNEFDIMDALLASSGPLSQRELSGMTNRSPATVNRTLKALEAKGFTQGGSVTEAGTSAMEPYRVKRAVFIAAGFGSRMVPVTLNTPKPLVRVHGVRIIDTLLDAVLAAGIEEIYIVRGYLGEQFDLLLHKYPMLRLVDNQAYNETNNISSAMCVREYFRNAYVFEADLILHKPSLVRKYQYTSNYLGYPVERTDDWCLMTRNGVIRKAQMGGLNCYRWIGISYWTEDDGARLSDHFRQMYEMPGGKENLWDMAPLKYFQSEYRVEIRECDPEDVIEIDTFRELQAIDPLYAGK